MTVVEFVLLVVIIQLFLVSSPAVKLNKVAHVGDSVRLNCSTTRDTGVDWLHNGDVLYVNGAIDVTLRSKYSIDKSVDGEYSLVISSVTVAEAGEYRCVDDAGHGPELITYIVTVTGYEVSLTTGGVADAVVMTSGPEIISSDENKSPWHIIAVLSLCLFVAVMVIIILVTVYMCNVKVLLRRRGKYQLEPNMTGSGNVEMTAFISAHREFPAETDDGQNLKEIGQTSEQSISRTQQENAEQQKGEKRVQTLNGSRSKRRSARKRSDCERSETKLQETSNVEHDTFAESWNGKEAEIASAANKVEELEKKLDYKNMAAERDTSRDELKRTGAELVGVRSKSERLEKEMKGKNDNVVSGQSMMTDVCQEQTDALKSKEAELVRARTKVERLEKAIEEKDATHHKVTTDVDILHETLKSKETEIKCVVARTERSQKVIGEQNEVLCDVMIERDSLKDALDRTKAELSREKTKVERLKKEKKEKNEMLDSMTVDRDQLRDMLESKDSECELKKTKVERLERELKAKSDMFEEMKTEQDVLGAEVKGREVELVPARTGQRAVKVNKPEQTKPKSKISYLWPTDANNLYNRDSVKLSTRCPHNKLMFGNMMDSDDDDIDKHPLSSPAVNQAQHMLLVNLDEDLSRQNCVTSSISGYCDCDVNDMSSHWPESVFEDHSKVDDVDNVSALYSEIDLNVRRPGAPMAHVRRTSAEDDIEGFVTEDCIGTPV